MNRLTGLRILRSSALAVAVLSVVAAAGSDEARAARSIGALTTASTSTTRTAFDPGVVDEPCERVLVALRDPEGDLGALAGDARKTRIRSLQDGALAVLASADPEDLHRYGTLPALAACLTAADRDGLLASPYVGSVVPDLPLTRSLEQTVPLIGADVVQALGVTGAGATVAVVDGGVDVSHPDLVDSIVAEQCFCNHCCPNGGSVQSGPGAAPDQDGHGTHVTGIITSDGFFAPVGVAPGASIVAVKVLSVDAAGAPLPGYTSDLVAALEWVTEERPDVDLVNLSLGTDVLFPDVCDTDYPEIEVMAQAIGALVERGVAVFAASGNDADKANMAAPACIGDVISVASVYDWDYPVGQSNASPVLDLFAPGSNVESSQAGGYSTVLSGTSMATPHATATAALVLQAAQVADVPGPTPQAMRELLADTGVPIQDPANGQTTPRIDAAAAVGQYPIAPWVSEIALLPEGQASGGAVCGVVDGIRVGFGKPVLASSFGPEDLEVVLPETGAPGLVQGVEPVIGSCMSDVESQALLCREFEIALDPLSASQASDWGSYGILIGTGITDFFGQPLDNDRDTVVGEDEDAVLVMFSVRPAGLPCEPLTIDDLLVDLEPEMTETLFEAEFEIWDLQIPEPTDLEGDLLSQPLDPTATTVPTTTTTTTTTEAVSTGGLTGFDSTRW